MVSNAQELAEKRYARVMAAINLEEPDRVPLKGLGGDIIPAHYGITQYEFCYDYEKSAKAIEKFLKDFPCDWPSAGIPALAGRMFGVAFSEHQELSPFITSITGPMHDVLKDRYYRFPGRELNENASPQFIGGTFMDADEYDEFSENPVRFISEVILPRTCRSMTSLKETMATMIRYGTEIARFGRAMGNISAISASLGYPSIPAALAYAPLDLIGDFLRGIENVLLDIRRCPEKVKKAAESLVDPIVNYALSFKKRGAKIAFIPLHLNEYLSPKLYNEFYWPTLKAVIVRLLNEGIKSWVFFEGYHDAHLNTILELPAGWGIAHFEKTDVIKAKKLLQNHTCVMGGIPINLIVGGTPAKIENYVKKLLEEVKPGGGFILAANIEVAPADTPKENLHALVEAVEKYG